MPIIDIRACKGSVRKVVMRTAQAESVSRRVRCPGDHAFQVNRASTSYLGV